MALRTLTDAEVSRVTGGSGTFGAPGSSADTMCFQYMRSIGEEVYDTDDCSSDSD